MYLNDLPRGHGYQAHAVYAPPRLIAVIETIEISNLCEIRPPVALSSRKLLLSDDGGVNCHPFVLYIIYGAAGSNWSHLCILGILKSKTINFNLILMRCVHCA